MPQTNDAAGHAADNDRINAAQEQPDQDDEQQTDENVSDENQDNTSVSLLNIQQSPADANINTAARQQAALLQDGQKPGGETEITMEHREVSC